MIYRRASGRRLAVRCQRGFRLSLSVVEKVQPSWLHSVHCGLIPSNCFWQLLLGARSVAERGNLVGVFVATGDLRGRRLLFREQQRLLARQRLILCGLGKEGSDLFPRSRVSSNLGPGIECPGSTTAGRGFPWRA